MNNISRGTVDGKPVATLGPEFDSPDCAPQPGPVPGDHPGWGRVERLLDEQEAAMAGLAGAIDEQLNREKQISDELRSALGAAYEHIAELEKALDV